MRYGYFLVYNVIGAALWVALCTYLGYLFGNIPVVKNNFSTVILLIILSHYCQSFSAISKQK